MRPDRMRQPVKLPLLGNVCVTHNNTRAIVKQRAQATMEEFLEAVSSIRSVPRLHKESIMRCELGTRVEGGSNTSTVTLRVVGGDEKGSLKSERVKYGH
jgi:hypothetical protein